MVTPRRPASSPIPWPRHAALKAHAELVAEDIREALDQIVPRRVTQGSFNRMKAARDLLLLRRQANPTREAANVILGSLRALDNGDRNAAAKCIAGLEDVAPQFAKLTSAAVLDILNRFDRNPRTAKTKGMRSLPGLIVDLAAQVGGALDVPRPPPRGAPKSTMREKWEAWRAAEVDKIGKRLFRSSP